MRNRAALVLVFLSALACGGTGPRSPEAGRPAFLLGRFVDDYGVEYTIDERMWVQHPAARYRVVRWDAAGRYLIGSSASSTLPAASAP